MNIARKSGVGGRPVQVLWLLSHMVLLPAEVLLLKSLGVAVWVPKLVPSGPQSSGTITPTEYDADLELPVGAVDALNAHNFYEHGWTSEIEAIVNSHFDIVVTSVYPVPLVEAVRRFRGTVIARVFGRAGSDSYTKLFSEYDPRLLADIRVMGERFVFGQAHSQVSGIEDNILRTRAATLPLGVSERLWNVSGTWTGGGDRSALLYAPYINDHRYYRERYEEAKSLFATTPHVMFGRQMRSPEDTSVLSNLSEVELVQLYQRSPVFAYNSVEPRYLHYAPIEAMVVGTPVLYRAGSALDLLARDMSPGRCTTGEEIVHKARLILGGDAALTSAVRASQRAVVDNFSKRAAAHQWAKVLRLPRVNPPWDPAGVDRFNDNLRVPEWWPSPM